MMRRPEQLPLVVLNTHQGDAHQRRQREIEGCSRLTLDLALQGAAARIRIELSIVFLAPRQNRVRHHDLNRLSGFRCHEAGAKNAVARDDLLERSAQQREVALPFDSKLPLLKSH